MHVDDPWPAANRPGVQGTHWVWLVLPVYVPALHPTHAPSPGALVYVPTLHSTHAPASDTPSVMLPYLPAAQATHSLAFGAVEYLPAGHPSHTIVPPPRTVRYPRRHTHWASVAPAGESEYAGHPVHDPESSTL